MVDDGRAKLPNAPGVLYQAPSKRKMNSFIRVGNIQRSRAVLDGMFFWLLPYLKNCIGLITDTWSISSISMNISRRLCIYTDRGEPPCPVEMLSRYHDGSVALAAEAAEIIERLLTIDEHSKFSTITQANIDQNIELSGNVVFLISATHTGSLVTRLKALLRERNITLELVRFVALFKIGQSEIPSIDVLRDLSSGIGSEDFQLMDEDDKTHDIDAVVIDEQIYFPVIFRNYPSTVRKTQTVEMYDFLTQYEDIELIKVHRTDSDDHTPRHHAIWVDTNELIEHHEFQDKLKQYINSLWPIPDLIVTPLHHSAERLGEIALQTISTRNSTVKCISHSNLMISVPPRPSDQETAFAVDRIPNEGAILILDDAFITGERQTSYQKYMRQRTFAGRIHYLVAIARPTSMEEWQLRRKMLGYRRTGDASTQLPRHTVHAIETIVLPNWSEIDCPWCHEMSRYRRYFANVTTDRSNKVLRDRLNILIQHISTGLTTGLFLQIPNRPPLTLTPDSILASPSCSQASVFAAVASALQRLRTENQPPLGPRRFPISTVLADAEYLEHTYTDSILRACFLRAAQLEELVYADRDSERKRAERARQLVMSADELASDISAEIVLAAILNKLPELDLKNESIQERLRMLGLDLLLDVLLSQSR